MIENILDFEKNWKTRAIKEAIYSEESEHHINGISFKWPNICKPILRESKAKKTTAKTTTTSNSVHKGLPTSMVPYRSATKVNQSKTTLTYQARPFQSFARSGGGGGSEARMPKIKVNINRLKWNFAWVIMAMKAFLMQHLRLIALLVLEIWRHKIFLWRRERVIQFGYLLPENGFNFKKVTFYVQIRSFRPKIDPQVNFSNFQAEENFFIFKIFGTSRWQKSSSNPLTDQFC